MNSRHFFDLSCRPNNPPVILSFHLFDYMVKEVVVKVCELWSVADTAPKSYLYPAFWATDFFRMSDL